MEKRPRVVIVGGGFGGLWAAKSLANKPVEVMRVHIEGPDGVQPFYVRLNVLDSFTGDGWRPGPDEGIAAGALYEKCGPGGRGRGQE